MRLATHRKFLWIVSAFAVASLATNVFLAVRVHGLKIAAAPPSENDAKIVERARKLIDLPKEDPTVATVTDLDKLKSQPFFAKAKLGYKVLIFSTTKKVVLYDPAANKIVNMAALAEPEGAAGGSKLKPPKVTITPIPSDAGTDENP